MTEYTIDHVSIRGVLWGLVAVLLGSLIYGLVTSPLILWDISQMPLPDTKPRPDSPADLIDGYLQEGIVGILGGILEFLSVSMLVGLMGFVLLAIPGALGGAILSNLIHYVTTALPSPIRVRVALLIGALIGGAPGFAFTLLLEFFPAPDRALEFLCFLPVWVGAFCGAWMGWRLASGYTRWERPFTEELPYLEALFRGLGWGFVASVLGSLIHGLLCDLFFRQNLSDGMLLFAILVIPGNVFGGAILGMSLHVLAVKTPLLGRNRALTGVLIGGALWFLVATFVFPFLFDSGMSIAILWLVTIATGAFIGWRLALTYGR
jgi:hypothetical protein